MIILKIVQVIKNNSKIKCILRPMSIHSKMSQLLISFDKDNKVYLKLVIYKCSSLHKLANNQ